MPSFLGAQSLVKMSSQDCWPQLATSKCLKVYRSDQCARAIKVLKAPTSGCLISWCMKPLLGVVCGSRKVRFSLLMLSRLI